MFVIFSLSVAGWLVTAMTVKSGVCTEAGIIGKITFHRYNSRWRFECCL